jgi:hypothetical protein
MSYFCRSSKRKEKALTIEVNDEIGDKIAILVSPAKLLGPRDELTTHTKYMSSTSAFHVSAVITLWH